MYKFVPGWPQRYPFMVAISFLYVFTKSNKTKYDVLSILILLLCILVTFTRSLYLAIIIPSFIFSLKKLYYNFSLFAKSISLKMSIFFVPIAFVGIIYYFINFETTLTKLISESFTIIFNFINNQNTITVARDSSSEGMRVFRWLFSFDLFLKYPLFGTGFRGIYQFSDMGSVHSQYFDVLLRSGITGFAIQAYLFLNIYNSYKKHYNYISYVILGILIFGIFNESIKQIFAAFFIFLLNNKSVIYNSREKINVWDNRDSI